MTGGWREMPLWVLIFAVVLVVCALLFWTMAVIAGRSDEATEQAVRERRIRDRYREQEGYDRGDD
jgi:uncharacterized membrane protein